MRVGLFFGTFNPIHIGHLIIADYMTQLVELDEVWLVVTPQNPHKDKKTLLADHHRLELVRLAIDEHPKLRVSDVEFKLPQPHYTIKTLEFLKEKYPDKEFALILGEDNLLNLKKWYNYENILKNYKLFVYPRAIGVGECEIHSETGDLIQHPNVRLITDVPLMKISASYIREAIRDGKSVKYLLTEPVYHYIDRMNFYRKQVSSKKGNT